MSVIQLLHGTDHIIEVPDIHIGNPHNDYGMGFYCTRVDEMARSGPAKRTQTVLSTATTLTRKD